MDHIAALKANEGTGYLPRDVADKLAADGIVQIHPSATDSNGNPAVRLTEKGSNMTTTDTAAATAANTTATAAAAKPEKVAPVFDTGVVKPAKALASERKPGAYDAMEVGQSAHFAGDPKATFKKYSSLPSALTRRFAEKVVDAQGNAVMETRKGRKGKPDSQVQKRNAVREFSLVKVGADDPRGVGVRLYRDK